jgi:hypothetical protein
MSEVNMEEKIHLLREVCIGIQTELAGMKDVLGKLSSNQEDLIALRERYRFMEQFQRETKDVNNKIFSSLRSIEQMRINDRLLSLENSRKFLMSGALLTIGCGTVLAIIKVALG